MKNKIAVFYFLAVFTCIICISANTASANNKITEAVNVSLNENHTEQLTADGDVDYYKFTLPADSKIDLNFKHNDLGTNDSGWHVQVIRYEPGDSALSGTETILTYFTSYGANKDYTQSICLPAGNYYLRVSLYKYYSSSTQAVNQPYQFNVGFTSGDTFEKEINGTIDLANNIQINTVYAGYLQYMPTDDVDYYKFTLPADGKIDLNFKHNDLGTNDSGWHVQVIRYEPGDSALSGTETILTYFTSHGTNKDYTQSICLPAGNYYLRVSLYKYYSSSTQAINQIYQFNVGFTPNDTFEKEINGTIDLANNIQINTVYAGYLQYMPTDDVDYYKFTLPADGKIDLNFKHNDLGANDSGWHARILKYTRDSDSFGTETDLLNYISYGKDKDHTDSVCLPAGSYYLEISLYKYYSSSTQAINQPYLFNVKFTQDNTFEKEPNDSTKETDTIMLNLPYTGYLQTTLLGSASDKDIYKFTLPGEDVISLNFRHNDLGTNDSGWRIRLFSIAENEGILDPIENELLNVVSKGSVLNESYDNIKLNAGEYYLEISLYKYYSSSTQAINHPYTLTVNSKYSSQPAPFLPNFDMWTTKNTNDVNKIWNVKFSTYINESSLNNNIFITDNYNQKVTCIISALDDGKTVAIAPANPYALNNEYRLYITNNICSKNGINLRNAIVMPFIVSKT